MYEDLHDVTDQLTDAARRLAAAIVQGYVPYSDLRPESRQPRLTVQHKGATLLVKVVRA